MYVRLSAVLRNDSGVNNYLENVGAGRSNAEVSHCVGQNISQTVTKSICFTCRPTNINKIKAPNDINKIKALTIADAVDGKHNFD